LKELDIRGEKHHPAAMIRGRNMGGILMRELIVTVLVFLLVTISLGGSACAAPCDSGELSDSHPCSLNMPTPDLPDSPVPPCCLSELLQGEQYVPGRKKSKRRKILIPPSAAALTAPVLVDRLPSRPLRPGPRSFSERPGLLPLYILHTAFLI
jgi:hypothetical protein